MALDDTKNFCKVTVSTGYTSTDTSIDLVSGDGAKLPTPPFNLVWYNDTDYPDAQSDPNKEIVRVTAVSGDTLTVTRGQEGTTAVDHNLSGKTYKMINAITKKMIDDINSHIVDTSNPHSVTAGQVGAITKVEDDTNPKLGGDLDTNDKQIKNTSGNDITIANSVQINGNISAQTPKAYVYYGEVSGTPTQIPDSTATKVEFDSVEFDTNSIWDSTNHRFIPDMAGYYIITTSVTIEALPDGKKFIVYIKKNGTTIALARTMVGGSDYVGQAASVVAYANGTTDYFEIYVYHNAGTAENLSESAGYNVFSIAKLP